MNLEELTMVGYGYRDGDFYTQVGIDNCKNEYQVHWEVTENPDGSASWVPECPLFICKL